MNYTELVLSNATSFFSGNLENVFRNAKKYGFKYVEIAPYRWNTPQQILQWQKKYGVLVAGIHLPFTSLVEPVTEELKRKRGLWNKFCTILFHSYLGNVQENPAINIAEALADTKPYFLIHSDIASQLGEKLTGLKKQFHVVIENIPDDPTLPAAGVFDHNHFLQARQKFPNLSLEAYKQAKPEVIHISYDNALPASFPNAAQQYELAELLKIHKPKYITIETNPLANIKKGKLLLERILNPPF